MEAQATKRKAGEVPGFGELLAKLDRLSERIFIKPRNAGFEKKLAESVSGKVVFNPPYRAPYLILYGSGGTGMLILDPEGVPVKEVEVGRPWDAGVVYVGTGECAPAGKITTYVELADFFLRHRVAELVKRGKAECETEALRDFILSVAVNAKAILSKGARSLVSLKNVGYSTLWCGWKYFIRWGEMYVGISKESSEYVYVTFLNRYTFQEELSFTLKKKRSGSEHKLRVSEFVKTPAYRALASTLPVAEKIAKIREKTFLLSYLGVKMHVI